MTKLIDKICIILLLTNIFVNCKSGFSQDTRFNSYLDDINSAHVTSLEEFMQRFNAEAFHPELNLDNDKNLRIRSILTLFDWQEFRAQDSVVVSQVVKFAESVCHDSILLNIEDSSFYAEACCLFSYKDKEIPINLVFEYENIRDDYYRWAVAGANGLKNCNLLDTIYDGYISPVQHELHFSELHAACEDLNKYISISKEVDQLSFVLGMINTGQLDFVACNKVLFHFAQVPGYVFVVDKKNRLDRNSGYLISKLIRVEELQKGHYINQLLGKYK